MFQPMAACRSSNDHAIFKHSWNSRTMPLVYNKMSPSSARSILFRRHYYTAETPTWRTDVIRRHIAPTIFADIAWEFPTVISRRHLAKNHGKSPQGRANADKPLADHRAITYVLNCLGLRRRADTTLTLRRHWLLYIVDVYQTDYAYLLSINLHVDIVLLSTVWTLQESSNKYMSALLNADTLPVHIMIAQWQLRMVAQVSTANL